ncbi:MAG TPA: hypothetical protein VL354_20600 [Spirochaetia bacterium]|nr:hypothetical protein [Spirochaetia bacterium]
MAQFYLLSVVANLVASLTLGGEYFGEKMPFMKCFMELISTRGARITVGISTLVVGVIKLFVLSPGEHVLILGDFLPAVTGVAIGALLLAQSHPDRVERAGEQIRKISATALTYKVPVAIAGIVVAFLHFLFPGLVIL